MPSGAKKRKAAKKKKELGLQPTSPAHSSHSQEGNGGDNSMAIEPDGNGRRDSEDKRDSCPSGVDDESTKGSEESERKTEREVFEEAIPSNSIAPDPESKDVHVEFVQSVKTSNGNLSGGSGSSFSSLDEESPVSVDDELNKDLGKLVDGDSAAVHPNKREVSQVIELSPDAKSPTGSDDQSSIAADNLSVSEPGKLVDSDSVSSVAVSPIEQYVSQSEELSPEAKSGCGSIEDPRFVVDNGSKREVDELVDCDSISSQPVDSIKEVIYQSEENFPDSKSCASSSDKSWVAVGNQSERELGKSVDSDSVASSLAFDPIEQVVPKSEELSPDSKFCSGGESQVVVDNLPESKLGKLEGSDSVASTAFDSIKQVVSRSEELSPNTKSCSSSLQEVQVTVDNGSERELGKQVFSQSEDLPSHTKSSPSKDPKVLDAVDFPSDNNEEKIVPYQGMDTKDEGEFHKEQENQASSEDKTTLVLPPSRPSSWRGCCGLFELLTGANT